MPKGPVAGTEAEESNVVVGGRVCVTSRDTIVELTKSEPGKQPLPL